MERGGYVYIISNKGRTTFYIGVTSNIEVRIYEHKTGKGSSFTHRYRCVDLIYYEEFSAIEDAIAREKQLKNWHREWKVNLIKSKNPDFMDLSSGWYDDIEINH